MDMINVKINGIEVSVPKGSTILEAARKAGKAERPYPPFHVDHGAAPVSERQRQPVARQRRDSF